jgi:hypothetical protein
VPTDPLADVAAIAGVPRAAAEARAAVDALLRHPAMRRSAAAVAARGAISGARASAALAGAADDPADPILAGAVRVTAAVPELVAGWGRSPRQVLARAHLLTAAGLADEAQLGRPADEVAARRVDQLLRVVTARTAAPGVVVAAVVHGELAALDAFRPGGDVLARAVERLILVATGVDPKGVGVPEAGHLAAGSARAEALAAYREGGPAGVGAWVEHCCRAYLAGAEEGLRIAAAVSAG